ncbi:uncharacterized protein TrAFT101_005305 [Trichoderma asperellum]|uniref:uncharacterized protein n=1 Tax=Trichoderma asperellum TaxID=101201 RepID=UPI00331A9137|nr:hypothetical protein TrAFT101_005305 [Trichoderma asperellum]
MAMATIGSPHRLTAYGNHADGIRCDDCSRLLRVFLRATLPAASHPHIGTSMAPPSLLPASAANKQGTGTGVSNYCAIKGLFCQLACSRFEQLPRMRLTTRNAPFLRSLSPDLPLAIEISIMDGYGADGYIE